MGAKSSLTAHPCAHVVLLCSDFFLHGHLASPFISEGKAQIIEEEKKKNEREKKASRVAGSVFSFMRVSPIL